MEIELIVSKIKEVTSTQFQKDLRNIKEKDSIVA